MVITVAVGTSSKIPLKRAENAGVRSNSGSLTDVGCLPKIQRQLGDCCALMCISTAGVYSRYVASTMGCCVFLAI